MRCINESTKLITYTEVFPVDTIYESACPIVRLNDCFLGSYLAATTFFTIEASFQPVLRSGVVFQCQNVEFGYPSNVEASANTLRVFGPFLAAVFTGSNITLNNDSILGSGSFLTGTVTGFQAGALTGVTIGLIDLSLQEAPGVPYTPAIPGSWPAGTDSVQEALDVVRATVVPTPPIYRTGRVPIEYLADPYKDYWLLPEGLDNADVLVFIESESAPVSAGSYTLTLEQSNAIPTITDGIPTTAVLSTLDLKAPDQIVTASDVALAGTSRYYKVVIQATNADLQPAPIGSVPQGFIHYTVTFRFQ